jgi:glycosyltransferase involved in cell wall biosynthesis
MKVVHLVCSFPPYRGGMGGSAQQLVERLLIDWPDCSLTVVCPNYGQAIKKADKQFINDSSAYQILRLSSWFSFGNAAILKGLGKIWRSADIIHLHYPFYGTDGLVWWLKKIYPQTKLVIHYHMDPQASGWRGWLFKIFQKLFLARLLKQSEAVTCASLDYWQSSAAGQLRLDLAAKLFEVPFRVDTKRFQPRPKDIKLINQFGLNPQRQTILMVGGLDRAHYFKGVEVFLQSLVILKQNQPQLDFQAIIVGDGDMKSSYQILARELDLTDSLVFAGAINSEELPSFYNLANLFVLPSINRCEAFGLVLLEAMASGLPCLASNLPGVRRVISSANGLLIDPNNANDLALRLQDILADQSKQEAMARASRQRAEQLFSLNRPSELVEIYQRINQA